MNLLVITFDESKERLYKVPIQESKISGARKELELKMNSQFECLFYNG